MKDYFEFDQDDKKIWMGLGAAAVLYVIAFSLFWGGVFHQVEKAAFFVLEDILPGYLILKLYLDKVTLSDNRIMDKLMMSFGLSLVSLELPFYLLKYLRPYESNTDEKAWGAISDTTLTLILLALVFGVTFGLKYYQNKKKTLPEI